MATTAAKTSMILATLLLAACNGPPLGHHDVGHDLEPTPKANPGDDSTPQPPSQPNDNQPRNRIWRVARDGSGDFLNIAAAVAAANSGDSIRIAPGRYLGAISNAGKVFSIIGEGAAHETIIDGGGTDVVVSLSEASRVGTSLQHLTITGSRPFTGEGLRVVDSSVLLSDIIVEGNGRGLHLVNTEASIIGCEIRDNVSTASGGGLLSEGLSDSTLYNSVIAQNYAVVGGGVVVSGGTLNINHSALIANGATRDGGGIYAQTHPAMPTRLMISNSVIAHTTQDAAIHTQDTAVDIEIVGSAFYDNPGGLGSGYQGDPIGAMGNIESNPLWLGAWPRGEFTLQNLYLSPDSRLKDGGWGESTDPDGSPPDIGPHGGPYAHFGFYLDSDNDDLYDGWEARYRLSPIYRDTHADDDRDGVTNLLEMRLGLDPSKEDTDGDGLEDLDELMQQADPLNPFVPSGTAGVPGQIDRLETALLRAPERATITLEAGTFAGRFSTQGRAVSIIGAGRDLTFLDGEGFGPVVTISGQEGPETLVAALTVTGGAARKGGGMYLLDSSPTLTDININHNRARSGGGMYISGGGPTLDGVIIGENIADDSGGGMLVIDSDLVATDLSLVGNSAVKGGGLATSVGGTYLLTRPVILNNQADLNGGGLYIVSAEQFTLQNALVATNYAANGGGITISSGEVSISQTTLVANIAETGGAIAADGPTAASINTSIIAYQAWGGAISVGGRDPHPPEISDTLLWDNNGGGLFEDSQTPQSEGVFFTDPVFVAEPWLGAFSPVTLHLAPGSPALGQTLEGIDIRGEIGMYGGSEADRSWYADDDDDSLPDGWELLWVRELDDMHPAEDNDQDGLSNLEEWQRGLGPTRADTDSDAIGDAQEVLEGTDPRVKQGGSPRGDLISQEARGPATIIIPPEL